MVRFRPRAVIHHSDCGSQYASQEFQKLLRDQGIQCSMSGTGNCYDNAVAESFFATLKRERAHRTHYQTREEAKTDLFQFIEIFYNRQRRHSAVGHRSPARFEATEGQTENWSNTKIEGKSENCKVDFSL